MWHKNHIAWFEILLEYNPFQPVFTSRCKSTVSTHLIKLPANISALLDVESCKPHSCFRPHCHRSATVNTHTSDCDTQIFEIRFQSDFDILNPCISNPEFISCGLHCCLKGLRNCAPTLPRLWTWLLLPVMLREENGGFFLKDSVIHVTFDPWVLQGHSTAL